VKEAFKAEKLKLIKFREQNKEWIEALKKMQK